jgi:hypothetical protein
MKLQTNCFAGITLLLCLLNLTSHAQSRSSIDFDDPEFIFSTNHFSFSLFGGLSGRAKTTYDSDRFQTGTSNCIAFGGGINYHYSIHKNFSAVFGLQVGVPVRNFEYRIPGDAFSPPLSHDIEEYGQTTTEAVFLLRAPVTIEGRLFNGKKKYWHCGVGASLVYGILEGETLGYQVQYPQPGQYTRVHNMSLQMNNNSKPWFNYHVTAGRGWVLKNQDILNVGLLFNLSMTDFITGTYTLETNTPPVVHGTYKFRGSYTGISAGYVLTSAWGRKVKIKK